MNKKVSYSNLKRSFEKRLTRKTKDSERQFIKWLVDKSNSHKEVTQSMNVRG
ncbi:hypothetical protein [Halalkalibacter urbisdiaboli]|uniref:hypothetical protein n=1 Tax=Halalkalibacter urbisdiaboli TaxID=1960589 RepID=UPI0013FD379F|nr:hypothetical protein [Halalkalibacter urbisdiaboli]